jgi:cytochrome c biogenesis protein ResB
VYKFARIMMWTALAAICMLALLCVLGAFYGAVRAKALFNSMPLAAYWCVLLALLVAGLVTFPRLVRKPGLLSIHAACLLVLVGGMWGSQSGHRVANRLLGRQRIPKGYLVIYEGEAERHLLGEDLRTLLGELPFSVMLKDFRLEYYQEEEPPTGLITVETNDGRYFQAVARQGQEISLGEGKGKITVLRTFRHFKIRIENGQKVVTDDEADAVNPALEVEIERPDGESYRHYVFERFPGFSHREDDLRLSYASRRPGIIRDFYSDVEVIENGRPVLSRTIEVNHPLHYAGYHFYQHSYDAEGGEYTILSVTSDSGLHAVFAGYWMLSLGLVWHFWLRHARQQWIEYCGARGQNGHKV